MRLLISGGLGFIGTNFIQKISKNKRFTILNIDKISMPSNRILTRNFGTNYKFIKLNIIDYKNLFNIFQKFKPQIVINFAAETHVDNSIKGSKDFIYSNIIGTYNLLECSKKYLKNLNCNNFKFIQISTDEVFGDLGRFSKNKFFNEFSKYDPSSPYSASKASADFLVSSWIRTYNFPAIITHTSNNYGPFQFEEKLIPLAIKRILTKKKIPIYGDGNQKRDWIYVDDNVKALNKILNKGKLSSRYMIGTGISITNQILIRKIFNSICEILPNDFSKKDFHNFFEFVEDRPGHDQHYKISSLKLKSELNWEPKISIDKGIKLTCNWYIKNKNWN